MEDTVELRWIFSVLRRWWLLIVVCTLSAAVAAYAVSSSMQPVYSATTTLLIDIAESAGTSNYNALLASEQLANTYSQMLTGRPVLEGVIARLGLSETPDKLADSTTVQLIPDTQLIEVSVESPDPAQAALLADAIAEEFVTQAQQQQAQRYTTSLDNLQRQQDELSELIEQTRSKIDALRARMGQVDVELAYKESRQAELRGDYRALEQEYSDLSLTVSQLADSINIIEECI